MSTVNKGTVHLQDTLSAVRTALEEYVAGFQPNATYKSAPEASEYMKLPIVKALIHALTGQRYYLVGSAGIGKTSFVSTVLTALTYKVLKIQAAYINVDSLILPVLGWQELSDKERIRVVEDILWSQFADDSPKVIFIDEISRADAGVANALMELLQEGSIGGKKIPNLVTVIAADNPQGSNYGKMSGLDFAQADRFVTVELDSKSTPWRRALAEEFSNVDLSKVFSTYDTLDAEIREVLNPRVLAFVIRALLEGFPGHYALPIVSGVRRNLVSRASEDVTKSVLDRIAAALGTVNRETIPNVVAKALEFAVKHRQNVYLQGRPGIGKTSLIKEHFAKADIHAEYSSATILQPEGLALPVLSQNELGDKTLELAVAKQFVNPEPWVWIVDEICRGSRRTQNAIMEPIQERTIGGMPTNLLCTIALNNPREVAGFKLDVGKNDLAQASRFALSIEIDAEHIAFGPFLKNLYGEDVATPFIEWWEDDLDDVGRVLCTPRALERMIGLYEAGNELQWGLPFLNGEYVKVPLVDLHARLEKRPLARLKAIVADVDRYEEELKKGKDEASTEHSTVFWAFYKAEVSALEAVRDVCVRLYAVLDRQHRIDLIRQGAERQRFWNGVLKDSSKQNPPSQDGSSK